ncbi:MAG TPA: sugar MFS transporter [Terriglobales bacterium]|nr:sugar MFS transporter [Terriglobales bacterium]
MANVTMTTAAPSQTGTNQSYGGAMAMVTTLFFMWGFLTCLNDILVPHLKAIFDLNYAGVMLIQFAFFLAYFLFSLPSGKVIEWFGYKRTMVTGLCTMGIGALLFIPAATLPSYPLFLVALMVLAGGMTLLQVSANPYVAVLGPPRTASSRLNLTQAFNSFGTFIAPYIGSVLILSGALLTAAEMKALSPEQLHAYRIQQASSVKLPYFGFAVALFLLAIVISLYKLPVIESAEPHRGELKQLHDSIWKHKNLVLGTVGIFVYVGGEVAIGSFLVNYMKEPYIAGFPEKLAAKYLMVYWGGAMVGRFLGSAILQRVATRKVLGIAATVAALLTLASMMSAGHVAMWSILAVGFFNSIMFPSIFTLGIDGLGKLTSRGSAILIAAIVGGAVIPELQGLLADRIGIHHAFILPVLCYVYIMYFSIATHEIGQNPHAAQSAA